jgi:hypothetical protein
VIGDRSSAAQLRLTRQMRQGQEEPDKYNTREKNFAAAYELGVPPNPLKSRVNRGQRQYSLRIRIFALWIMGYHTQFRGTASVFGYPPLRARPRATRV